MGLPLLPGSFPWSFTVSQGRVRTEQWVGRMKLESASWAAGEVGVTLWGAREGLWEGRGENPERLGEWKASFLVGAVGWTSCLSLLGQRRRGTRLVAINCKEKADRQAGRQAVGAQIGRCTVERGRS